MRVFAAIRSYFSCPWTSFILLIVMLLEAVGSVFFIADLPLYWKDHLKVSPNIVSMINYGYGLVSNLGVFAVAILTDNFFGRFSITAFHFPLMVLGFALLSCSLIESVKGTIGSFVLGGTSYVILAFAFGIMRAIYPAFTADQFVDGVHSPESRDRMFSWLYLLLNLAAVIALVVIAPFIKSILGHFLTSMGISLGAGIIFGAVSYWFVKVPRTRNVVTKAIACIFAAIFNLGKKKEEKKKENPDKEEKSEKSVSFVNIFRSTSIERSPPKADTPPAPELTKTFLDRAYPRYEAEFLFDVLQVLEVSKLLLVGIPYWLCLRFVQAIWYFHGVHVNYHLGAITINYYVLMATNAGGCIFFVLFFTLCVYPFMNWLGNKGKWCKKIFSVSPLRKMGAGAFFSLMCFIVALATEVVVRGQNLPPLKHDAQLIIWGHHSLKKCDMKLDNYDFTLPKSTNITKLDVSSGSVILRTFCPHTSWNFTVKPGINVVSLFPAGDHSLEFDLHHIDYSRVSDVSVAHTNYTLLSCNGTASLVKEEETILLNKSQSFNVSSKFFQEKIGTLKVPGRKDLKLNINDLHGAHILVCDNSRLCGTPKNDPDPDDSVELVAEEWLQFEIISPHKLSMWWVVGEAVIMAMAEATIGIGAMEFAYDETASSMKTVMQAMWFVMAGIGFAIGLVMDLITENPLAKIGFTTTLMFAGNLIFFAMAYFYKTKEMREHKNSEEAVKLIETVETETLEVVEDVEEEPTVENSELEEE